MQLQFFVVLRGPSWFQKQLQFFASVALFASSR